VSKEQTTAAEGEIPEAQEQQANEQNSSSPQTVQSADSDPFLLHSSVLPTLNVPLYEALAVDIPLCNSPLECINADARRVNSVVEQLLALTQNEELGYAAFAKNMIYRVSSTQAPTMNDLTSCVDIALDRLHIFASDILHQSKDVRPSVFVHIM
jgi:hypothetical protein